ncbi:MAG: hypothetical protein A2156_03155 [Deltaproteobacteria bacterium RBG_16_48_10]|nr:MAG: hypothetical protein A2156_03155 [Deltaproteobacteria bacterium RBG_16_48_10]
MNVTCIDCEAYKCHYPEVKKSPPQDCPRKNYPRLLKQTIEKSRNDPSIRKINIACEEVLKRGHDSLGYNWTRMRELIEYARVLGYKRMGIAGCIGLIEESKIIGRILTEAGFYVALVSCMAGGAPRSKFGLKERDGGSSHFACNPLMQAEVLNQEKTDLNVMVGLCLGHDILFIKNSKADVTPLIVKDRVTGHNPVAALYTSKTYYKQKLWNPSGQRRLK